MLIMSFEDSIAVVRSDHYIYLFNPTVSIKYECTDPYSCGYEIT